MDEAGLAEAVEIGKYLFADKLFITSMNVLWIYDYLLTLGDEINCAWSGRRSLLFALFIAIRYIPVAFITWINITMFHYSKSFCQDTKWIMLLYTTVITTLAQITVALRIYGVTGRNRTIRAVLFAMVIAQFSFGIYYCSRVVIHPVLPLPDINLGVYEFCFYQRWRAGEYAFTSQMIIFDVIAFAIIFATAKRPKMIYPGIPSLLDTILRDATFYFLLVFASQVCLLSFMSFAPDPVQLMPGIANTIFIPMMASRLMLSLKRAAVEPQFPETILSFGGGWPREGETLRFASGVFATPRDIQGPLPLVPNNGDIELVLSAPLSAQNHEPSINSAPRV